MSRQKGIDYKKYPVLFVDDEEAALFGFTALYKDEFTIFTAPNGRGALEILKSHPEIAMIISDQRMPGMTGVELLYQARLISPEAVRMLITAYTELEVVIEAINTGNVYRFISKPYHEEELRFAIRQGIERTFLMKERDALFAEKIEALKKVARSNRLNAVGVLAAGMAHEINNPLVAINTFLEILPEKLDELVEGKAQKIDKEYWEEFHGVAWSETKRIQSLIGQLLNYAKTTDQDELVLMEVDLNDLIRGIVSLLQNEAKKKGTDFEFFLHPELPRGKMDREKMRQVILNLVLNSIQATQSGKITLRTSLKGDEQGSSYFEVQIADTGSGISEENLNKLFNPFYTTKETEGTGLGLMTCHHIIDQHRGSIDIESKIGKGTTATARIPLDPLKFDRRKSDRRVES